MNQGETKIMLYVITALLGLISIILIIGLCLPKERIEQRKSIYQVSPEILYEIVTNNNDFSYRSDLKDLQIIETKGDFQTWREIGKNGQTITFRTTKKEPYSRYEFEIINANGFKGYWTSEFRKINQAETEFIATEHVIIENPVIRLLSYLFFDLGKFMENYQKDLSKKIIK